MNLSLSKPLAVFVTFTYDDRAPEEFTYHCSTLDDLTAALADTLNHSAAYWQDSIEEQFNRTAVTVLRGDFDQNGFKTANYWHAEDDSLVTVLIAAGSHGIKVEVPAESAPAPAAPVATMRNENSGVPSVIRTYAPIRATGVSVSCHPANGGGATINLESPTLAPADKANGYFVGGIMAPITFPENSRSSKFAAAIAQVYMTTAGRGYVGFWNDNGTIVAEASEWMADREAALAAAASRNEDAIYDVAAGSSIYL